MGRYQFSILVVSSVSKVLTITDVLFSKPILVKKLKHMNNFFISVVLVFIIARRICNYFEQKVNYRVEIAKV